jgi:LysR family glycine cleavage system transcriptional activator
MQARAGLPPIQYLPAFEAAARLLSFKLAAEELCVTPPAISQQVKAFENWLGKALFIRRTRMLELTEEGVFYLNAAQTILREHREAYREFDRRFKQRALYVSGTLFLTQEILLPNYLRFKDYLPATELRLEARMSYVDFRHETIDAAVRFGHGQWPGTKSYFLSSASVTPVCSPAYAALYPLSTAEELLAHRLIYAPPAMSGWEQYFCKSEEKNKPDAIVVDSYLAALKAASDGLGIALAILPTANKWLAEQRLVRPLNIEVALDRAYWLVVPEKEAEKPETLALLSWLEDIFADLPRI